MQWYVFLNRVNNDVWLLTVKNDNNTFNQFITDDDAQSLKRSFEQGQPAAKLTFDDTEVALDFSERVFFSINDVGVSEHRRRLARSQVGLT